MDELEIINTSDGSHTLRNNELNETYHSVHGAIQESQYVFIRHGLQYYHETTNATEISVLEIGFGTGLNAFLTAQYAAEHHVHVRFTSLETYPLQKELWTRLNYAGEERHLFEALHAAPWDSEVPVTPFFAIEKRNESLQHVALNGFFDVVFFDAFAPSVQPEMWTHDILKKTTDLLAEGGVFVTYSAKGQLKRDLRSMGLRIEALPGPVGKREMVRSLRVYASTDSNS